MLDPENIYAFQRLSDRITTSGRVTASDLAQLQRMGVKRVVNLAPDTGVGALAGEAGMLAELGIAYVHIPIPFRQPTEAHYAAFVTAIEESEETLHVHCMANWRVSAFFYRYHREHGMDESEARALLRRQWTPEHNVYPGSDKWAAIMQPESE